MNEQQARELMNTPTKPGLTLLHTLKLRNSGGGLAARAAEHVLYGDRWSDQYLGTFAQWFAAGHMDEDVEREHARGATNELLEQLTKAKAKVIRKWSTAEDAPIALARLLTGRSDSVRIYIREGAPAEDLQAFKNACVFPNTNGRHGPYQGTPLALRDFDDWSIDYPGTNTGRLSMTLSDSGGEQHPHLVLDGNSAWIRRVGAVGTLLGKSNTWGARQGTWASASVHASTLNTMIARASALIADDFPVSDEVRESGMKAAVQNKLDRAMYSMRTTYPHMAHTVARYESTWLNDEWVAQWVEAERANAAKDAQDKARIMADIEDQVREAYAEVDRVLGPEHASEFLDTLVARNNLGDVSRKAVEQVCSGVSA